MDIEDVRGADRHVGPATQAGGGQGGVHGPGREDRRDRQAIHRHRRVGHDQQGRSVARQGDGVERETVEGRREAGRTHARIPRRVQRTNRRAAGTDCVQELIQVGDHRATQPQGPGFPRHAAEQRRAPPELDAQVHHDAFPFGVDRRVRHLGERLAEVIGDRSVEAAATGGRRVVAHAPQWFMPLERHRLDVQAGALGIEAGQVPKGVGSPGVARGDRGLGAILEGRARGVVDGEPAKDPVLGIAVFQDRAAGRLDQEQLAGAQAAATNRVGCPERHRASL